MRVGVGVALAERPDLSLHGPDGNRRSPLGAFLTAAVLTGRITGDSPAALADFPDPDANEMDRRFPGSRPARWRPKPAGKSPGRGLALPL